ncbi:MAG: hypothetical protein ACE5G2_08525 [Candidatus Krumholzibacteriia bacterium]
MFVWHGRCGMLRLYAHFEGGTTDENGMPAGRLVSEETTELVDLELVGRRR